MMLKRNFYTIASAILLAGAAAPVLTPAQLHAQSSYAGQFFPLREGIVNDGTTVIGPPHKGLFGGIPTQVSYDTKSGWADMAMPALSYHFRTTLSMDMALPYYLYTNAVQFSGAGAASLESHTNAVGDLAFAAHYSRNADWGTYTLTGSTCAPVGDKSLGLSAGRMTGGINNHFARNFRRFDSDVDAGFSDSSNLVRESSRKNYTSLGDLIFLQGGTTMSLRRAVSLTAHVYDQLPAGKQTVFTSIQRKAGESTVLRQTRDADDYGLSSSVDVALTPKMGFSTSYSYSAPLHDSVIGASLTVLLFKPVQR